MVKHDSRWLAPTPLWGSSVSALSGESFKQPAILRFDNDAFMDEFMGLLETTPERLQGWIAKAETWRKPMSKDSSTNTANQVPELLPLLRRSRGLQKKNQTFFNKSKLEGADINLKLYQPAQQRFYLISASLICKTAGLPDKQINTGEQEKVSFVLRRVFEEHEYAFTVKGKGFEWQKIKAGEETKLSQTEERLPLFNINYQQSTDRNRRILAGLIPVARREAYLGAAITTDGIINQADADEYSPLQLLFQTQVVAPWKSLIQLAEIQKTLIDETNRPDQFFDGSVADKRKESTKIIKTARESIQTISWYILLDFADFLETYIPEVLQHIKGETTNLTEDETALYEAITNMPLAISRFSPPDIYPDSYSVKTSMADALQTIQEYRAGLEKVDVPYSRELAAGSKNSGWPDFLFPLTDPETLSLDNGKVDNLAALVANLLPTSGDNFPDLESLKINKGNANNANFIIRCVYEQPQCEPIHAPILSEPSEQFEMAAFFDPDAPARPIRIPMPMDISPAGLRKYQKNTSLIISDMLCGKIAKIKKLTLADLVLSILPWPFHKDLPNVNDTGPCGKEDSNSFGIICSLSIPIVTLVALILMIIMVTLFDIFFKWIPYLFMCLPIPGLSGKNKP